MCGYLKCFDIVTYGPLVLGKNKASRINASGSQVNIVFSSQDPNVVIVNSDKRISLGPGYSVLSFCFQFDR